MKVSFQIKLFISLVLFFSGLLPCWAFIITRMSVVSYTEEMSARAKIQAEEIAIIPNLRKAVAGKDIPAITQFMHQVVSHSDASFIVIGDNKGLHLFHSVHANVVGKTLVGGDNEEVLRGLSTTTIRKGGLGISLRSKAPIFDDNGQVVGIVSVGYLTSYLDTITLGKVINIFIAAVLLLAALFIFSGFSPAGLKIDLLAGAARNWPVSTPAKGNDGVHLRRGDRCRQRIAH